METLTSAKVYLLSFRLPPTDLPAQVNSGGDLQTLTSSTSSSISSIASSTSTSTSTHTSSSSSRDPNVATAPIKKFSNLDRDPDCYFFFIHNDFDHNCSGYCCLGNKLGKDCFYQLAQLNLCGKDCFYQLTQLNLCGKPHYYYRFIDNDFNNNCYGYYIPWKTYSFHTVHKLGHDNTIPNGMGLSPQEKSRSIQPDHTNRISMSHIEPDLSHIRQSSFIPGLDQLLLHSLASVPQGEVDSARRVTIETTIIGRMVEHIHHLESQLAGDGFSDAPPPTYAS
ncbi:hypothetical protein BDP27DRAFT_1357485 [Rhodocollybia butyracea]|uniref:Uncharacterized protein n=1 Tax=Rhodocollybia butyracea TaxID=206335 RepID=A0A9P5UFK8_9AGAR|nr:hypothetical protein BDP27DRAFT_1357485 [Rhodocollybia butyracea]